MVFCDCIFLVTPCCSAATHTVLPVQYASLCPQTLLTVYSLPDLKLPYYNRVPQIVYRICVAKWASIFLRDPASQSTLSTSVQFLDNPFGFQWIEPGQIYPSYLPISVVEVARCDFSFSVGLIRLAFTICKKNHCFVQISVFFSYFPTSHI